MIYKCKISVNMNQTMIFSSIGYVKAGLYRTKILLHTGSKMVTPIELSKELNIHPSQVSRTLNELSNKGIIECVTPTNRKGKLFSLTKLGQEIYNHLNGGENAETNRN